MDILFMSNFKKWNEELKIKKTCVYTDYTIFYKIRIFNLFYKPSSPFNNITP